MIRHDEVSAPAYAPAALRRAASRRTLMRALASPWMLAAVVAIGAIVRFVHLGRESLWLDEAFSMDLVQRSTSHVVSTSVHLYNPPLYFLLLHWWTSLFGTSEFAGRALSLLFGVATIAVVYAIGRRLFGPRAAVLAALFTALAPFQLTYSQEVRNYSLLALLTGVSYYFFIESLRGGSHWMAAGYVASTAAMLYTHYYGVFTLAAQAAFIVGLCALSAMRGTAWIPMARRWALLQGVTVLLFVPWLVALANSKEGVRSGLSSSEGVHVSSCCESAPPIRRLIGFPIDYAGSRLLYALVAIVGAAAIARRLRTGSWLANGQEGGSSSAGGLSADAGVAMLALLAVSAPFLGIVLSHVVTPFYIARYTIGASLGFYLLAGLALAGLRWRLFSIAAVLLVAGLVRYGWLAIDERKEQWRQVAAYVDRHAGPRDLVVFDAPYVRIPFDFYSKRADLQEEPGPINDLAGGSQYSETNEAPALRAAAKPHPRVWLVVSHSHHPSGFLETKLSREYAPRGETHFQGIDVVAFDRRTGG